METIKPQQKPSIFLFQEVAIETQQLKKALERLDFAVECYTDPKLFLLDLKNKMPTMALVDASTPQVKVATAILMTVKRIFGPSRMIVSIISAGDKLALRQMMKAGATSVIEKPVSLRQLAQVLAKAVVTDGIANLLGIPMPSGSDINKSNTEESSTEQVESSEKQIVPEVVSWYFENMMPVLARMSIALERFDDVETQFKYYVERLTPYHDQTISMIRQVCNAEDNLDLLQSLRKYGISNSRALVIAMTLSEAMPAVQFGFNPKTGLLNNNPKKVIAYANRIGEYFGEDSRYYSIGVSAGLVLDILSYLAGDLGDRKLAFIRAMESCYSDMIKSIDKAFKLAKNVSSLSANLHIASLIMLREAGILLMDLHYADYAEVRANFAKKKITLPIQHLLEIEKYGVSHNLVGALICQVTPGLERAYKAVLFYDYPYLLGRDAEEKELCDLVRLCRGFDDTPKKDDKNTQTNSK